MQQSLVPCITESCKISTHIVGGARLARAGGIAKESRSACADRGTLGADRVFRARDRLRHSGRAAGAARAVGVCRACLALVVCAKETRHAGAVCVFKYESDMFPQNAPHTP